MNGGAAMIGVDGTMSWVLEYSIVRRRMITKCGVIDEIVDMAEVDECCQ